MDGEQVSMGMVTDRDVMGASILTRSSTDVFVRQDTTSSLHVSISGLQLFQVNCTNRGTFRDSRHWTRHSELFP